jgi:hypothetical protein
VTSQPKTPFFLNGIAALALLRLHQKCGRALNLPRFDAFLRLR